MPIAKTVAQMSPRKMYLVLHMTAHLVILVDGFMRIVTVTLLLLLATLPMLLVSFPYVVGFIPICGWFPSC